MKRLSSGKSVLAERVLTDLLSQNFGRNNIKVVEKAIENRGQRY